MNNYRPISIFTGFSKVIEKILYARLYKFLKKHNVIYKNQYRYQSNVSTVHAILDVVTSCNDNINESCYTALSFVDIRKAFDKVLHETLLVKTDRQTFFIANCNNTYTHTQKKQRGKANKGAVK